MICHRVTILHKLEKSPHLPTVNYQQCLVVTKYFQHFFKSFYLSINFKHITCLQKLFNVFHVCLYVKLCYVFCVCNISYVFVKAKVVLRFRFYVYVYIFFNVLTFSTSYFTLNELLVKKT